MALAAGMDDPIGCLNYGERESFSQPPPFGGSFFRTGFFPYWVAVAFFMALAVVIGPMVSINYFPPVG